MTRTPDSDFVFPPTELWDLIFKFFLIVVVLGID
jgi:hypothetical protein